MTRTRGYVPPHRPEIDNPLNLVPFMVAGSTAIHVARHADSQSTLCGERVGRRLPDIARGTAPMTCWDCRRARAYAEHVQLKPADLGHCRDCAARPAVIPRGSLCATCAERRDREQDEHQRWLSEAKGDER